MVKLFLKNSNLCDHNSPTSQTDGRTDRQTTCDRNTALCTKVHRAVKTTLFFSTDREYSMVHSKAVTEKATGGNHFEYSDEHVFQ